MSIDMVRLIGREEVADGTMAFHFEKPAGFLFKAGQFADFTLIDPPETDAEGNIRGFSLASAPYEKDLEIATRMRDTAFKRVMKRLPYGTQLKLDAPYGSFTLPFLLSLSQAVLVLRLFGPSCLMQPKRQYRAASCFSTQTVDQKTPPF